LGDAAPSAQAKAGPVRPRPQGLALVAGAPAGVSLAGRARRGTSGALYLQSAPAGLNSPSRPLRPEAAARGGVEDRVPRSGESRTVSGPEGSSTQRSSSGAAERPGPSRLRWWARVAVVDGGCTATGKTGLIHARVREMRSRPDAVTDQPTSI